MANERVVRETDSFEIESRYDVEPTRSKVEGYFNLRFWQKRHRPDTESSASVRPLVTFSTVGDKSLAEKGLRHAFSIGNVLMKTPRYQTNSVKASRELYGRRHFVEVYHLGDRRFRFEWCLETQKNDFSLVTEYERDTFRKMRGWAMTVLCR